MQFKHCDPTRPQPVTASLRDSRFSGEGKESNINVKNSKKTSSGLLKCF